MGIGCDDGNGGGLVGIPLLLLFTKLFCFSVFSFCRVQIILFKCAVLRVLFRVSFWYGESFFMAFRARFPLNEVAPP